MAEKRINGRVQPGSGGGGAALGQPVDVTIAAGIVTAPGLQNLIINAETGTTDDLTQITGLDVGLLISISPASGDTITVKNGANMDLARSDNVMAATDDNMLLEVTATGVCREKSRSRNT